MQGYAHTRAAQDIYKGINKALPDAMKVVNEANQALAATKGINRPTWTGKKPGGIKKFFRSLYRSPGVVSHVDRASSVVSASKPIKELQSSLTNYKRLVDSHHGKIPPVLKKLNRVAKVALPIIGVAALVKTVANATHNTHRRANALREIASTTFKKPPAPPSTIRLRLAPRSKRRLS